MGDGIIALPLPLSQVVAVLDVPLANYKSKNLPLRAPCHPEHECTQRRIPLEAPAKVGAQVRNFVSIAQGE
ncbi:MAG TPA: hypothetical protein VFE46_16205 [Pirellulales bacterium]|jgi:hypothetical protein|nr:hypothetical protein [Pirellulales bacterium]